MDPKSIVLLIGHDAGMPGLPQPSSFNLFIVTVDDDQVQMLRDAGVPGLTVRIVTVKVKVGGVVEPVSLTYKVTRRM